MESKKKISTKSVVMAGMFAAVLAVLSQIAIPMPSGVPVTLQTFAVALTGAVLGWKLGIVSTAIYLLLGAVGVPVFSGFSGGLGILFGKTGGFLFGFLFLAGFCGIRLRSNRVLQGALAGIGLLICHFLGVLQFMVLTEINIMESALLVSLPYIVKDIISVALAFVIAAVLKKSLNAANIWTYEENA